MTQATDWSVPLLGPATPTSMAERIDKSLDALLSSHSGSARPAYAVAGTEWISTATAGKLKFYLFDGASDRLLKVVDTSTGAVTVISESSPDFIKGLITTRINANQISVGAGSIKGNGRFAKNAASVAKNINATWSAGAGSGGMEPTKTVGTNKTYFIHALVNSSDGSFDWMYSPDLVPVNVPVGYEIVGRIWAVYTNSSSQIFDYSQVGNNYYGALTVWLTLGFSVADGLQTIPAAIPCPDAIPVRLHGDLTVTALANTAVSTALGDAGSLASSDGYAIRTYADASGLASQKTSQATGAVATNTARQVRIAASFTGGGSSIVSIGGWEDFTLNRIF